MAASLNWKKHLNNHPIFKNLRGQQQKVKATNESENIFAIKNGEIYAWSKQDCCIYTTNLKHLVGAPEHTPDASFQILLCSDAPSSDIHFLVFNEGGTRLILWGKKTLSVLDLPQRWGKKGMFQGGKDRIICQTTSIAARFLLSTPESLLQVGWYPGSTAETYLTTLTSDSTIRIYSIYDPDQPILTRLVRSGVNGSQLPTPSASFTSPRSPFGMGRVETALGETAVDFDFGLPVQREQVKLSKTVTPTHGQTDEQDSVWPVYVLMGDGDIFVLYTSMSDKSRRHPAVHTSVEGPLPMFPPAEDNYGTDSCSIICLPVCPPVIVIATCEGKLHHCVALGTEDTSKEPWKPSAVMASPSKPLKQSSTSLQLFVYESVELELSLTLPGGGEDDGLSDLREDELTCPIHLLKDPIYPHRYHCYHEAGVHTVVLPWHHKLQQFYESEQNMDLPTFEEEEHAIVEHLVCTRPVQTSPPCPVMGLTIVDDLLLGPALLALTSALECIVLPLVHTYKSAPPRSALTPSLQSTDVPSVNFEERIRKILQRAYSNPFIKTAPDTVLSSEESWQIVARGLQGLREEFILKQEHARDEIQARQRLLLTLKEQQEQDIKEMLTKRTGLTTKARELAHKYDQLQDHYNEMRTRLEGVLRELHHRTPTLSNAEVHMKDELKDVHEKLKKMKATVQQLKQKKDYQERQMNKSKQDRSLGWRESSSRESSPRYQSSVGWRDSGSRETSFGWRDGGSRESSPGYQQKDMSVGFGQRQQKHLLTTLKQEGTDIADLIKRVKHLQSRVENG